MININANKDNQILIKAIATYPYYLFVFTQPNCVEYKEILSAETDCTDNVFNINTDIPMGVYELNIYGQSDYVNTVQENAEYITTLSASVYNPANICWSDLELTDEFNYPLQDQNFKDLQR